MKELFKLTWYAFGYILLALVLLGYIIEKRQPTNLEVLIIILLLNK